MKQIILPKNHSALRFLCLLSLFAAIPSFAGPKLECDAAKFDFGSRISGAPITNTFSLVNSGNKDVVISKIKNCCGVTSVIKPMTIPPGETATCQSIFNTKNRYGKQEKQILIATNARWKPYVELKMVGELLRPVEYEPKFFKLGAVTSNGEINLIITATNMLQEVVTLDSVESMVQGLKAEIRQNDAVRALDDLTAKERKEREDVGGIADPAAEERGRPTRSWRIRVTRDKALPEGKLMGRVRLNFSTGAVNVPVMGQVKPSIRVTPDPIQFGAGSSRSVERLVMLRSSESFEVVSASLLGVDGCVRSQKMAPGVWRVRCDFKPATIQEESFLRITTTLGSAPSITIPISRNK